MADPVLSILIPANNEADHIETCLQGVLAQEGLGEAGLQVIVAANGCSDTTVDLARAMEADFAARGWDLTVLDIPEGSKPGALNAGDAVARAQARAYLDADIVLSPPLLAQVLAVLARPDPVYATGRMQLARAKSWVSRRYGSLWIKLPFMQPGTAQGAGFFAVNAAGRARWGAFPDIIADDTFVRWSFSPKERVEVEASYSWPLVEGFSALVHVRRRQDAGGAQLRRLHPDLEAHEAKPGVPLSTHLRLALTMPVSYAIYIAVQIMVRQRAPAEDAWARGTR
jgi:glycosyltransferase involved in cell wall biosynthesis